MTTVDKMQALNQRVEDLDKELVELQRQRDSLALAYSQNDKTAIKQVAQCDAATDQAKREIGLLRSAIEQLKSLAEDQQAEIIRRAEEEHSAKAATTAASIASLNEQVDAHLKNLRDLLETRASLLNQLTLMRVTELASRI